MQARKRIEAVLLSGVCALLLTAGVSRGETIYYHSGVIEGSFTSYSMNGYPVAVKYDLPDPTKTYEIISLGLWSQGRGATFPTGTEVAVRVWDVNGVPVYTSDPFDWSGQPASLAFRTMYIDEANIQVSSSFYLGYQVLTPSPTSEFGYRVDHPTGNQYGHSYRYKVSNGTWTAKTDDDLMFEATIELAVLPGDTNGDGVVDAADYIWLKNHFGEDVTVDNQCGDLDGNDLIGWGDLQVLMNALAAAPPVPTPEPATLGLLAIGALAVLRRRRKA